MKRTTTLIFLTLIISACGQAAPLSLSEPAPTHIAISPPETIPTPETSSAHEADAISTATETSLASNPLPTEAISIPGLRVVYLRGGNLWTWVEASGISQLTNSGDMSSISVSDDGQMLAFMRGREVWTVHIDGSDARVRDTQTVEGGALWFSPNKALLAVSTSDHIDVLDLNAGTKITVTSYDSIPNNYFPEVFWMLDSSGFKTVIPSPSASGQAEMLYVFPDGTVASLAKFSMGAPSNDLPSFSPDGGYVVYAELSDDSKMRLHLMDSSGATRPYGDSGNTVHAYGWLPDSRRFVFTTDTRAYLGNVSGEPVELMISLSGNVQWIDEMHYISLRGNELLLGDFNGAFILLDSEVTDFDVILLN